MGAAEGEEGSGKWSSEEESMIRKNDFEVIAITGPVKLVRDLAALLPYMSQAHANPSPAQAGCHARASFIVTLRTPISGTTGTIQVSLMQDDPDRPGRIKH